MQDRRRLGNLLHQNARHRRSVERQFAGQHLVRHYAETVEIGAAIDFALAGRLLGAHELGRPDRHADPGECRTRGARQGFCDPEVGHHHPAPGSLEEDVVRLDVAMNDRQTVGG